MVITIKMTLHQDPVQVHGGEALNESTCKVKHVYRGLLNTPEKVSRYDKCPFYIKATAALTWENLGHRSEKTSRDQSMSSRWSVPWRQVLLHVFSAMTLWGDNFSHTSTHGLICSYFNQTSDLTLHQVFIIWQLYAWFINYIMTCHDV